MSRTDRRPLPHRHQRVAFENLPDLIAHNQEVGAEAPTFLSADQVLRQLTDDRRLRTSPIASGPDALEGERQ